MAFPSSRSQIVTNGTTSSATPSVNLPATIAAGDTLLVFFRSSAGGAIGWPAGWTELFDESTDASANQEAAAWRKADGTEGATISLTSGSGKFAAVAYSIRDAADPLITPPQLSTIATGSATEPNATAVTPTGGAKDYLFLTVYGMEGEQTGVTSYPASYTGAQLFANSGTAGAVTTNVTIGSATRQLNAASDDAGVWDVTGTLDDWSAYTFAFHPANGVPAPLQTDSEDIDLAVNKPHRYARHAISLLTWVLPALTLLPQPTIESQPVTQQKTLIIRKASLRPDQATSNLLLTTLAPAAPVAPPFSQTEWPNPRPQPRAHGLSSRIDFFLIDTNPEIIPVAFPNPIVPPRPSVGLLTWTQSPAVPPAVVATLPPGRAELPRPPPRKPTLLIRTRTVPSEAPAAAPFQPIDWTLPLRRPALSTLRTWIQTRPIFAVDQKGFGPTDWPNPQPVKALRFDQLTQVQERPFFYAEPGIPPPGRLLDQPLPQAKPFAISLRTWTQNRPTFAVDQQGFGPTEWPNPQPIKALRLDQLTHVQERPFFYAEPGAPPPGRLLDQPLPQGKLYPVTLRTLINTRQPFHVDIQPFSQTEWPNAVILPRLRELVSWQQERPFFFAEPGTPPPGRSTEWPNPLAKVYPVSLRTLLNTRQGFHVDEMPRHQRDWPNPLLKASTDLRTIAGNGSISSLLTAIQPFAQTDWSLARALARLRIEPVSNLLTSTLAEAQPFSQEDWPNPLGRVYPIVLRTHLSFRAPHLVDLTPAALRDWPNPRGKAYPHDLRTWTQEPSQPEPIPFALRDWPNPRGKAFAIELRTFLNAVELQLLGKDQFFGGPGQAPANLDWPLPKWPGRMVVLGSQGFSAHQLTELRPLFGSVVELKGSYDPILFLMGSYAPDVELIGSYVVVIELKGSIDGD